jgi:hypothetical protein
MRSGLGAVIGVIGAVGLPGVATADRLDRDPLAATESTAKLERSFSQQIADRLTWLGNEMNQHMGNLSFDRVAIRFDGRARRARIRLGKGDGGMLSMRIDGDIKFEHGLAHVDARVDLSINGYRVRLDLPKVDLVPSSYQGEKYLEVRIPLIQGTFEPETWFR